MRTALVVIDMQAAWLEPGAPFFTPPATTIIPRINRIASGIREAGGLVVWIQHTSGVPGTTDYWSMYLDNFVSPENRPLAISAIAEGSAYHRIFDSMDVQPQDLCLQKKRFSAFIQGSSLLDAALRERDIDTVIIAGTQTNMCCESTARDAMMLDYRVFMPADACAARTGTDHRAGLRTVAQIFGDIRPTDALLDLLRRSRSSDQEVTK